MYKILMHREKHKTGKMFYWANIERFNEYNIFSRSMQ